MAAFRKVLGFEFGPGWLLLRMPTSYGGMITVGPVQLCRSCTDISVLYSYIGSEQIYRSWTDISVLYRYICSVQIYRFCTDISVLYLYSHEQVSFVWRFATVDSHNSVAVTLANDWHVTVTLAVQNHGPAVPFLCAVDQRSSKSDPRNVASCYVKCRNNFFNNCFRNVSWTVAVAWNVEKSICKVNVRTLSDWQP